MLEMSRTSCPINQIGEGKLLPLEKFEFQQDLGRVVRVPGRVAHKSIQALACRSQYGGTIAENGAVTGYDSGWIQFFYQVKSRRDLVKCAGSLKLWKNNAETLFPQCVS